MAQPQYFITAAYEVGASQAGMLQYFDGINWITLGNWAADDDGSIVINSITNPIVIPWREQLRGIDGEPLYNLDDTPMYNTGGIFYGGGEWKFRLVDNNGNLISNIITFTFPLENLILTNINNQQLNNLDGQPLTNL